MLNLGACVNSETNYSAWKIIPVISREQCVKEAKEAEWVLIIFHQQLRCTDKGQIMVYFSIFCIFYTGPDSGPNTW